MPVDVLSRNAALATWPPRHDVAQRLLDHYDRHARDLPWRARPGDNAPDPYRVWLSEVMLQQTTVAAVRPYFERFLARWPTLDALAAANDAAVMGAWAGLGYYARARNLLACARAVVADHGGRFPGNEAMLRQLPGLGAYTAAAIAAIAFGQRAVVVDANVVRVVARLFAIADPLPRGRAIIDAAADSITPDLRAGDFAQAMMDLGATICTVRAPACGDCPLNQLCAAHASGTAERYPVKAAKVPRPVRHGMIWWMERDGAVWLIRRPARGLLGGMRALPSSDWGDRMEQAAPFPADWRVMPTRVDHVFTHFALRLTVAVATVAQDPPAEMGADGQWWPIDALADAGLPTVFAKAALAARNGQGVLL